MIGVDEVGRGCLAGPLLVVAARQKLSLPPGLADSKVLSKKNRQQLLDLLIGSCDFGEGWVSPQEIDKRGLSSAMRLGVKRALKNIGALVEERIIMDGPHNYSPKSFKNIMCVIDADATIALVSAASIYAKVKRDHFMLKLALKHPSYGFDKHVGYGTPQHLQALQDFGPLKFHRRSCGPIYKLKTSVS